MLLNFLSGVLREEGGFEFKQAIVDCIIELLMNLEGEGTREAGLYQLCEFIEDCEFTPLSIQILHLLGDQVPKTSAPARFIR